MLLVCCRVVAHRHLAEAPLTGSAALQLLAGSDFKFKCGDGLNGYGQFDRRGSAWAAYKFGAGTNEDPEVRANATVRAQGNELCFTIKGLEIAGEICAPVAEKSSGTYRFGTKDDWCEVQVIQGSGLRAADSR